MQVSVGQFEIDFLKASASGKTDSESLYEELHAIAVKDGGPESTKFKADLKAINEYAHAHGTQFLTVTGLDEQAHRISQEPGTKSDTANARSAGEQPARLAELVLQEKAVALHEAIIRRKFGSRVDGHDFDKSMTVLNPVVNPQDIERLKQIYHDKVDQHGDANSLLHEAKAHFSEYEYRQFEAKLATKGTGANSAGNLMSALAHAKEDSSAGNPELRAVLEVQNSRALVELDKDFRTLYGVGYKDALNESAELSAATRRALPILAKGCDYWQKDKDSIKLLAHIAAEEGDARLLKEALRVDTPEAGQARKELAADQQFKQLINAKFKEHYNSSPNLGPEILTAGLLFPIVFPLTTGSGVAASLPFDIRVNRVVTDVTGDGRISLKTTTEANTENVWFLNNKNNIELNCRDAGQQERSQFNLGYQIAHSDQAPHNASEKHALNYYNIVHKAFLKAGSTREASIWEDELMHGRETIISDMAKCHSDGFTPLGLLAHHSKEAILNRAENLSQDDWKLLRSENGASFKKQIEESLKIYVDAAETARIMNIINQKCEKNTYAEAAEVHRPINEVVSDNNEHIVLGLGTSYDTKTILQRLTLMKPDDAAAYQSNQNNCKTILDQFVDNKLNVTERVYAKRLLEKVTATGKPAQLDNIDRLLYDDIQNAPASQTLRDAEKLLSDPAVRTRFKQPDQKLSNEDRIVKNTIEWAVTKNMNATAGGTFGGATRPHNFYSYAVEQLFDTGHLPLQMRENLGFDKEALIADVIRAPEKERAAAIAAYNPDERAVVSAANGNPNQELDLADRLRLFVIGSDKDYNQFYDELQRKPCDELQKLRSEYTRKYGGDLDHDFISHVDSKDREKYRDLIFPAQSDGRQMFYDHVVRMIHSESGLTVDGTRLSLEKSNDRLANELAEYERIYQTLPPEKQQALDTYFDEALNQYKGSKEKLAEIVVDATITAAALAAAPVSGGASMALVVSLAAAGGAVARPLILQSVEGNDFDSTVNNFAKQAAIGGFSSALNFIGGEAFVGAGQVAKATGARLTEGALSAVGKETVELGGRQTLEKGLTKLTERYAGQTGKQMSEKQVVSFRREAAALVEKAAPRASTQTRAAMTQSIEQNFARTVSQEEAAVARQLAQRTRSEIVKDYGKQVLTNGVTAGAANAASEVVIPALSGGQVDWNNAVSSSLVGFGTGNVIGALIHAPGLAKDLKLNLRKERVTTSGGTHEVVAIHANDQSNEIVIHQTNGKEVCLKPGDGQTYYPQNGDEISAAPTARSTGKSKLHSEHDTVEPMEGRRGETSFGPITDASEPKLKPVIVDGKLNPDAFCVVHTTDYFPTMNDDGSVSIKSSFAATDGNHHRNTIHFTINHKVTGHNSGNWDSKPYTVIAPFNEMVHANGAPSSLYPVDTFWSTNGHDPLRIPGATVVGPAEVPMSELVSYQGNRVFYKTKDFTASDEAMLTQHENTMVPEKATAQERETLLARFAHRFASDEAMKRMGYDVQILNDRPDFSWEMNADLAKILGKDVLRTLHSATEYARLETQIDYLLDYAKYQEAMATNQVKYDEMGIAIGTGAYQGIRFGYKLNLDAPLERNLEGIFQTAKSLDPKTQEAVTRFGQMITDRVKRAESLRVGTKLPDTNEHVGEIDGTGNSVRQIGRDLVISPGSDGQQPHARYYRVVGNADAIAQFKAAVSANAPAKVQVQELNANGSLGKVQSLYVEHRTGPSINNTEAETADVIATCQPDKLPPALRDKFPLKSTDDVYIAIDNHGDEIILTTSEGMHATAEGGDRTLVRLGASPQESAEPFYEMKDPSEMTARELRSDLKPGVPKEFAKNYVEIMRTQEDPIISVDQRFLDEILTVGGIQAKETWIKEKLIVGTLGREPYLPEGQKRFLVKIKNPNVKILPRYTGPDSKFHGVVIFGQPFLKLGVDIDIVPETASP